MMNSFALCSIFFPINQRLKIFQSFFENWLSLALVGSDFLEPEIFILTFKNAPTSSR